MRKYLGLFMARGLSRDKPLPPEEAATRPRIAGYRAFNRMQILRLEKRWLETDHDRDQKGEACLGKLFPSTTAENQKKRDDVDPQMGELPW